jgi:imidazolonepropionase
VNRHAIVGSGRLLPMTGRGVGGTEALLGPWVVLVDDGLVVEVRSGGLRPGDPEAVEDVGEALVTPGLVDPHTHLIHAGDRSDEAAARSRGDAYTGGGILRTVATTTSAGDAELVRLTRERLADAASSGTTTIEVKSGYGLTPRLFHLLRLALFSRLASWMVVALAHCLCRPESRQRSPSTKWEWK